MSTCEKRVYDVTFNIHMVVYLVKLGGDGFVTKSCQFAAWNTRQILDMLSVLPWDGRIYSQKLIFNTLIRLKRLHLDLGEGHSGSRARSWEHWAWSRITPWVGRRSITEHHTLIHTSRASYSVASYSVASSPPGMQEVRECKKPMRTQGSNQRGDSATCCHLFDTGAFYYIVGRFLMDKIW